MKFLLNGGKSMGTGILSFDQIKKVLEPVFRAYGVRKATLFGSYARGNASVTSDVDLLVDSGLRGLRFIGFAESVKEALDRDADVFDVTHIEPDSQIAREIQSTGVIVYEP